MGVLIGGEELTEAQDSRQCLQVVLRHRCIAAKPVGRSFVFSSTEFAPWRENNLRHSNKITTVGDFVGTPPTEWYILLQLGPNYRKTQTAYFKSRCRVNASRSDSCSFTAGGLAKPLYGLTPVPRVRIPPSPPDFQALTVQQITPQIT